MAESTIDESTIDRATRRGVSRRRNARRALLPLGAALGLFLASGAASAQESPSGSFGFGFTAGQPLGGHLVYAIIPGIHIGAGVGFLVQDGPDVFFTNPYGKFLFDVTREFKPYVRGEFILLHVDGDTNIGLGVGGGAEYFANEHFGIFGGLNVFQFVDPDVTQFGLLQPQVGVEWFF